MVSINRTIRGSVDMTTVCVRAPPRKYLTPYRVSPGVMPVATKTTSSPRIRSFRASYFISHAHNAGPGLEGTHLAFLVESLLPQDRRLSRDPILPSSSRNTSVARV